MASQNWAYAGLALFLIYLLTRVSFSVPIWLDLIMGFVLGILILPTLFFRSASIGIGILVLFVLAYPSLSSMEYGKMGKPGLLFLFALWVILLLIVYLGRSNRR
jgi:hypothetical protein